VQRLVLLLLLLLLPLLPKCSPGIQQHLLAYPLHFMLGPETLRNGKNSTEVAVRSKQVDNKITACLTRDPYLRLMLRTVGTCTAAKAAAEAFKLVL
jgi:hypothetical protein